MKHRAQNNGRWQIFSSVGLVFTAIGLLLWMVSSVPQPAQAVGSVPWNAATGSGADLTVEISIDPAVPAPNQGTSPGPA